nr:hypothetical protein [Tanacetum cinerariifolium]
MRRVGKGFSRVKTPVFEGMLVAREVGEGVADEVHDEGVYAAGVATEGVVSAADDDARISMNLLQEVMDTCTALTRRVEHLELDKIAQALEITKLKRRVKKLEKRNKVKVLKLRRLQKGYLEEAKDAAADPKDDQNTYVQPTELQEVVDIVTTAKIITEVVTAASTTITAADVPIPAATTVAASKLTAAPSRRTKGVVIRDPEEFTTATSTIIHSEAKSNDKGKRILVKEPKPLKKQAQIKQDERYTETTKGRKLDDEVEELKRHLEIVPNEADDLYTEATPLARKVHVVDYEIYNENNKPYYKMIRADDTHQLYISFLSLLRNFDKEDLEALWSLVKERFATTKPKNFSDDFLLMTLGAMFEKPNIHAQIWKN